jgi:hypothetical protein
MGLGQTEWTMRTLGVVHAYVGVFTSLLSLPPRLRGELPQKNSKKMKSTMADHKFARRLVSLRRPTLHVQTTYFIQQHTPDAASGSAGVYPQMPST